MKSEHFKMETLHTVKSLLQKEDWMTKVDLKDAFFMVPIAKQFHHLLLFEANAESFQSPLGYALPQGCSQKSSNQQWSC